MESRERQRIKNIWIDRAYRQFKSMTYENARVGDHREEIDGLLIQADTLELWAEARGLEPKRENQ